MLQSTLEEKSAGYVNHIVCVGCVLIKPVWDSNHYNETGVHPQMGGPNGISMHNIQVHYRLYSLRDYHLLREFDRDSLALHIAEYTPESYAVILTADCR